MGATEARRGTLADLEQAAVRRKSSAGIHHEYASKAAYSYVPTVATG